MKIVKFEVNGREFEFVCDSHGTRSGFAHDVTLFVNGVCNGKGHAYWCNRTWESWTYQTACIECCRNIVDRQKAFLKAEYKEEHGLTRLAGEKHKKALNDLLLNDDYIRSFVDAIAVLKARCF